MKHVWKVPSLAEQKADKERYPGRLHESSDQCQWATCTRCGVTVMVDTRLPQSRWWEGWKELQADCDSLRIFRNECLDYLEGDREDLPSPDTLTPQERQLARGWLESLQVCRRSMRSSFPSVADILAGFSSEKKSS